MTRFHIGLENLAAFSNDYFEARARFLDAARRLGGSLASYSHPEPGPGGRELTTDVARWGTAGTPRVLMLICGTHGVEGLPGSACMLDWLFHGTLAGHANDVTTVLVHALNPFGMAWRQRQTEDNVDLNRNFREFATRTNSSNPLYDELHDALVLARPGTADWVKASAELSAARARHGHDAFYSAIMAGQHAHPDGLYFCGLGATWSHRTLLRIVADHAPATRQLAVVDFHTGLGPYGYGVLGAADRQGSGGLEHAHDWYGAMTVRPIQALIDERPGSGAPRAPMGDLGTGLQAALPDAEVTHVALEFGTYDAERFVDVYRANCWMQIHGSRTDELGSRIATDFEAFFYPRATDWQEMVLARSRQVTRQAAAGLQALGSLA